MADSTFSDLLHRAEQLTADMDTGTELPRIERNLPQLAEAANRLLSKTGANLGENTDVKASLLLSTKGLEVPKLSQRLESLSTTKTFEPLEPVVETDIQGFLKNERENAILSAIEETKRNTFAAAEKLFMESLEDEWEKEKQKILNSLLSAGKQSMSFPVDAGRLEDASVTKHRSALSAIEMGYARQIYICNEKSIQGQPVNFLESLRQVGQKSEDKNVKDLWQLLETMMSDLPPLAASAKKSRASKDVNMAFVRNGKRFLEERYRTYIEDTVYQNLQQAQLGALPGLLNLVKSFLKVRYPTTAPGFEDGTLGGIPVWPIIYFCLRCGDADATYQAAEALPPQFSEFKTILKEYLYSPDGRLHPIAEGKIRLQYRRNIRTSPDPFKRIVYCVIGCCDSSDSHPDVATKTDDYLWLKLNQIRFDEQEDSSSEAITLEQLQKLLFEEYGEVHFKAYDQPFVYCQTLFLAGMFEAGIEFLSRIDQCRCHAIHLAIVLNAAQLLLTPDVIHAQLLSSDPLDPAPTRRLNYARLITIYTRKFEVTDPREALEYFYLLRHLTSPSGENLFASCVSELVLETREFETLLGSLNPDGSRKPGAISKFKLDTTEVVSLVAKDAENKGQFEDAATLYDLGENHEKVLEILNNLLVQMVSLASSPQSSRERLQNLARTVAERYKTRGHNGTRTRSSTFYLLIDVMYFFDLYHENQHETALDVIQKIKLIPLSTDDVEQKVTSFRQYSDEVRQALPDILLATMNILYVKYKKTKSDVSTPVKGLRKMTDKDDSHVSLIRQQARALVTFAGLLPYRMPGDTNARLVQLEVMMN